MATKKTPATPALPSTPVTPTLPVKPEFQEPSTPDVVHVTTLAPEVTKGKPIKVRHKKTGSEHEVSYDYYQRNKSVLECL